MRSLASLLLPPSLLLLTLACGTSQDPAAPDAGPNLEKIWAELQACELVGSFRIDMSDGASCSEWPKMGESLRIERQGDQPMLYVGALALPVNEQLGDCVFVAAGCQASSSESGDRYLAPQFEVSKLGGGIRLAASAVDVQRGYVGPCTDASFEAQPIAACDPIGEYESMMPASISDGSCDLDWGMGKVEISQGLSGYDLSWGGTEIRGLQLDEASCSLRGGRGSATEFWLYNNAMRTVQIDIVIDAQGLRGSAVDALDGETFDGKSCAGATFALDARRPVTRETEIFDASCSIAKPVACGDGVCEVGESCFCEEDCGCQGELSCAPDGVCRSACTIASEAESCAAGERCSPISETPGTRIFPYDELYCDLQGSQGAGETCQATTDCAAGLLCHYNERSTVAVCSVPCGEGFAQCAGENEVCGAQGDGSGSGSYPTALRACERRAQLAEDCSVDACASGLSCLQECINGVCEKYCTRSCSSGCTPELPVCSSLGVCTKS